MRSDVRPCLLLVLAAGCAANHDAPAQSVTVDIGPEGGSVELAGLSLEVRDTGPGFPAGDPARLFQPFYTTKSSGTGLGLSLCQKVVTAHGGDIRAERRGELTVFRVTLPADESAALRQKQEEAS